MYQVLLLLIGAFLNFAVLFVIAAVVVITEASIPPRTGSFPQMPEVQLLNDGHNIRLLRDFSFIDPSGATWKVPSGFDSDGASIPRALWTLMGAPLTGAFRDAAIIHDYYCEARTRSDDAVHRVFYYAMLTRGVHILKAKTMYAGVIRFGPRWRMEIRASFKPNASEIEKVALPTLGGKAFNLTQEIYVIVVQPNFDADEFNFIRSSILIGNPSLEAIERMANEKFDAAYFEGDFTSSFIPIK